MESARRVYLYARMVLMREAAVTRPITLLYHFLSGCNKPAFSRCRDV